MYKNILVAYDKSDHAREATRQACALANAFSSTLHIMHVPQLVGESMVVGYNAIPLPPTAEEVEKASKDALAAAGKIATDNGVETCLTEIGYGDPAGALVDYAAANKIDLIVLGRRGLGSLTGLLIGSVTTKVCQLADCPVLTVK